MIAKLFSEPRQHKSCIHRLEQHSCFFLSSLCSVTHQCRLCIANRTNLWESFAALLLLLFSVLLSVSPPAPSPPPPPFTLYDLISRILPMCVRAGQESREAVRSLGSVFCVWTASNCSISCTQSPQLGFFKKKNTKIEYWAQICIFTAFYIFTVASGFILLFGATGELLPPTTYSTAVLSLQPFPDIAQDFRQTPHLTIFSRWVHVCVSDSRTPAFQLCVLHWNGLCKGAPAEPNLRKWAGGF